MCEITDWLRCYRNDRTNRFHAKMKRAADEIDKLRIEVAGKNAVIDALHENLSYYRKDQMINMSLRDERDRLLVLATKHCDKDHRDWQEILRIAGDA